MARLHFYLFSLHDVCIQCFRCMLPKTKYILTTSFSGPIMWHVYISVLSTPCITGTHEWLLLITLSRLKQKDDLSFFPLAQRHKCFKLLSSFNQMNGYNLWEMFTAQQEVLIQQKVILSKSQSLWDCQYYRNWTWVSIKSRGSCSSSSAVKVWNTSALHSLQPCLHNEG